MKDISKIYASGRGSHDQRESAKSDIYAKCAKCDICAIWYLKLEQEDVTSRTGRVDL